MKWEHLAEFVFIIGCIVLLFIILTSTPVV